MPSQRLGRARLLALPLLVTLLVGLLSSVGIRPADAAGAGIQIVFRDQAGDPVSGACYEIWTVVDGEWDTRVKNLCNTSGSDTVAVPNGRYAITETQPPLVHMPTMQGHVYTKVSEQRVDVANNVPQVVLTHQLGVALDVTAVAPDGSGAPGVCFASYSRINGRQLDHACSSWTNQVTLYVPTELQTVKQESGPTGHGFALDHPLDGLVPDTRIAITMPMRAADGTIEVEQRDTSGNVIAGGCYELYIDRGHEPEQLLRNTCDYEDGADGIITFGDLEPASYRGVETSSPDGYLGNDEEFTVSITGSETERIVRTHEPMPLLSVVTTGPQGETVAGSCWRVHNPGEYEGWMADACDSDDGAADGTTVIAALPPGDYELRHSDWPNEFEPVALHGFEMPTTALTLNYTLAFARAPENLTAPMVTGALAIGAPLTGNPGTWSGTQPIWLYGWWERCDSTGANCNFIADSGSYDEGTYTPKANDVGSTFRFVVEADNQKGTVRAVSAATAVLESSTPVALTDPWISGGMILNRNLVGNIGTWSGAPTSFTYQWQRCDTAGANCAAIGGATTTVYKLTLDDVGHKLRFVVAAHNGSGSGAASSAPSPELKLAPPKNIELPTISSPSARKLVADPEYWQSTRGPIHFAFQWLRCDLDGANCTAISGATSDVFDASNPDSGRSFRVQVTGSNEEGSTVATSEAFTLGPRNVVAPSFYGSVRIGQELKASHGTWVSDRKITYKSFAWYRCDAAGENCEGQWHMHSKDSTYEIGHDDVGHTIRLRTHAESADGWGGSPMSAPSAVVVAYPPVNTVAPTLNGSVRIGQELKATHGTWSSDRKITYKSYAWYRCDAAGDNCEGQWHLHSKDSTYEIGLADIGHTIRVRTHAESVDGWGGSPMSAPSAVVVAYPPVSASPPTVTGSVRTGSELTGRQGHWASDTKVTYQSFAWYRCDAVGENCEGQWHMHAKDSTYEITHDDVGHTIRLRTHAENTDGWGASQLTPPTAVVVAYPPVNVVAPTVSGGVRIGDELTATHGVWASDRRITYKSYAWYRCDAAGDNCEGRWDMHSKDSTYEIGLADIGHTIRLRTYAENSDGWGASAMTPPTPVVVAHPPVNTVAPVVTGTARVGHELKATHGTWSSDRRITYKSYAWYRCDAAGENCEGQWHLHSKDNTYEITSADIGHTIRLRTHAENSDGWGGSALTPPSPVVAP